MRERCAEDKSNEWEEAELGEFEFGVVENLYLLTHRERGRERERESERLCRPQICGHNGNFWTVRHKSFRNEIYGVKVTISKMGRKENFVKKKKEK